MNRVHDTPRTLHFCSTDVTDGCSPLATTKRPSSYPKRLCETSPGEGRGVLAMAGFSGITEGGARCRAIAITGSDYYHAHHPGRAEPRRRSARKGGQRGGRGRPLGDVARIQARLEELAEAVLDGKVDRASAAAVAGQLLIYAVGLCGPA